MEKANKNDDEKKELFLKKHWENIKKVTSTPHFIYICVFLFFIVAFYILFNNLYFNFLQHYKSFTIYLICLVIFVWSYEFKIEYVKRGRKDIFVLGIIYYIESLFVLIMTVYLFFKNITWNNNIFLILLLLIIFIFIYIFNSIGINTKVFFKKFLQKIIIFKKKIRIYNIFF